MKKIFHFFKYFAIPFYGIIFLFRYLNAKKTGKKYIHKPDQVSPEQRFSYVNKIINALFGYKNIALEIMNFEKVPKTPVVFVLNLKSNIDPFLIFHIIYKDEKYPIVTFLAKDKLIEKKYSYILDLIDVIFVDVNNFKKNFEVVSNDAIQTFKLNRSLAIFPEFKRVSGDSFAKFHPQAIQLAYKGYVPIVPVAIYNSENQMFDSNKKNKFKKPLNKKIVINFGKAWKPHQFINMNLEKCTEKLAEEIKDLYQDAKQKHENKILKTQIKSDHQEIIGDLKSNFKSNINSIKKNVKRKK